MASRNGSLVTLVLIATAAVITPLVLSGVYLGYYLGGLWGYSKSVLAIVFSTAGFLAAVVILRAIIVRLVEKSSRPRP
jgi:hypothetical protein